jgi:hypothetical protein
MKANEALELARSYSVEVRLNVAGTGLDLAVETDPPQALMNILARAKHEIVATLRQREIVRRRPIITMWINDHFTSTPPGVCRHCGNGAREGDIFVRLYCGDDSGDVHASCQVALREAEEVKAYAALGLVPLPSVPEYHLNLLLRIERAKPNNVNEAQWEEAMRGLRTFLATGHADEALRLGWPEDELFCVPELWSQIHLCGAALLIGDREVVGITAAEIRIRTASGSTLAFYRKPAVDYGVAYRARIKELGDDGLKEEPRLRAFESVVGLYLTNHPGIGVDEAKAAVQIAIAQETTKETTTP